MNNSLSLEALFGLKHSTLELPVLTPYYFSYKLEEKEIVIFPQLHNQVVFSHLASVLITSMKPDLIALELPIELETSIKKGINRLPVATIIHNTKLPTGSTNESTIPPPKSHSYIVHPGEALFWAGKYAQIHGFEIIFIDTWSPHAYKTWTIPIDYAALSAIGWNGFWKNGQNYLLQHLNNPIHSNRTRNMAENIIGLSSKHNKLLVMCGAAHWPIIAKHIETNGFSIENNPIPQSIFSMLENIDDTNPKPDATTSVNWNLADIHPHSLHLVTHDLPYFLSTLAEDPLQFDWIETLRLLFFEAEKKYHKEFDDNVSPATYRRLFQYLRNLCRLQGKILPTLYDIITVSKAMVDDDYAFEVYKTAINYNFPPNEDAKLDTMFKFVPDEAQGEIIKFAFKRRFRRVSVKTANEEVDQYEMDPIPEETWPGQWRDIWDKYSKFGYVSYPPEDEYIEKYLAYLRKRIHEILMEEQATSTKFESSLEDGIDYRNTARHWHEGEIYVKKIPKRLPEIGALVVQFIEEPFNEQEYNHHSTLFAEHEQESHISVITTQPGDVLVGPGITRVKYVAIISQFPPVGWPALIPKGSDDLKSRLISTAMNMALSKIIGFVSPKPPSAGHRHFAAQYGFRIVYLPMSQLTKSSLHRLRTMHLLVSRELRDHAREYIGF